MEPRGIALDIHKSSWISANGRHHWAALARRKKHIRELAYWTAKQHRLTIPDPCIVIATIGYRTTGKADVENAAMPSKQPSTAWSPRARSSTTTPTTSRRSVTGVARSHRPRTITASTSNSSANTSRSERTIMRSSFEGQYRPAGGISFDAANTMHGGYAEATPTQKHIAGLHAVAQARDQAERRTFLDMLGLPRPGRE